MITTKRNGNVISESYARGNGQVALLERPVSSYNEFINSTPVSEVEDLETAKARMQANLEKLLNYDRYNEEVATAPVAEEVAVEEETIEVVASESVNADEDLKPTSTTMQFGDGDLDQMYREMNVKTEEKQKYRLNAKGKLIVVIYSLAIAVIMTLIILNTGLLASIKSSNAKYSAELSELTETYSELSQELAESDNAVHEWALANGGSK